MTLSSDTLERLFRDYHGCLVRYLTRRLGDRDWAEEVAQETFVRELRQLERGALANERAWLFQVATNLVRDEARRDARRRRHLALLTEESRDEHLEPVPHERNTFRQQHGLTDKFVVMYSGNHGPSAPLEALENLAAVASHLKHLLLIRDLRQIAG